VLGDEAVEEGPTLGGVAVLEVEQRLRGRGPEEEAISRLERQRLVEQSPILRRGGLGVAADQTLVDVRNGMK